MNALPFQAQHNEHEGIHQIPERQRDWYEFRKKRKIFWQPRKSELQYIGSIHYSFDRGHAAVGSFSPDRILNRQFPRIIHIDQSIISALSERRIVWTPHHQAKGNLDQTEWKAYYLKVCRSNYPNMPIQIRYEYANDATFDTLEVTADTQRIKLYIAKSLRDLYHAAPFEDEKPKRQRFKVEFPNNKTTWHKAVKYGRNHKKGHDSSLTPKVIMKAIENRVFTQDELQAYITGKIGCKEALKIIKSRANH